MKLLDLPGKHERERAELEARHEKERLQLDQQQEVARLSFLESCEREQQELPTKVELRKRELIAKKEEMLRRAEQERLVLQDKFSQAEQELSTMRYAVERKHKEQELADLQAQIAGVEKRRQTAVQDLDKALQDLHAPSASDYAALEATQLAEYKKLLTKQEGERSTQRYLQEVERRELADVQKAEYTVVKVLEEFAAQEHLVFQRKRQRKWKEKKTITEGRFLWKNTREVIEDRKDLTWEPLPDGVAQTGARSWSIEGTPRGFDDTCTLVYTVNLIKGEYGGKKTRFEVVVRKNSNTYQQCVTSPEDSVRVIEPGEYTEIARTNTYEATEDSLGYTLGNLVRLEKGGACGYVIRRSQCPPPPANYTSACGGAHPIDVYGRPLEAVQLPVSSQPIWKPSKHLRVVPTPEGVALYHTLRGNLRFAPRGILEFLAEAEKGTMLSEVEARFPDVAVKDEIQEMSRLGFLTPDNQEPFIAITPRGMERGNRVRWLRLNTAVDCNLACTYCHGTNDMTVCAGSRMPVETALRAVRVFCDLLLEHNVKYMQIRYFGGEPLLNWPAVLRSMDLAQELAVQHGLFLRLLLNTNATLITQRLVEKLAGYRNNLTAIVSIDGPAVAHDGARVYHNSQGSFEAVLCGLDRLQEAGIPVEISATFGAHNQDHLRSLVDMLLKRNIRSMSLDPIRMVSRSDDPMRLAQLLLDVVTYGESLGFEVDGMWKGTIDRLEHGSYGAYCGGSGTELSILPSGDVYPCQSQPIRLGTLDDIESRALFSCDAYRYITGRVAGNLPDCQGCDIEGLCAGGCAADACAISGDLFGRTQFCEFNKALVQHYLGQITSGVTM